MLLCPQCQFDNPDTEQACQQCGRSLTQHHCHRCGTDVAFTALFCPRCHAFTGQLRWAIVTEAEHKTQRTSRFASSQPYLDEHQRYQLVSQVAVAVDAPPSFLELHTVKTSLSQYQLHGQIVDTAPLRCSLLLSQLSQSTPSLSGEGVRTSAPATLPQIALPYWQLQPLEDALPALPKLHDAWQSGHQDIVILHDRSDRPILTDAIRQQSPTLWQIIYWCYEILQLWPVLANVSCRQSLLVANNLRVDEDQTLCLQRLYADPLDQPPQLSALAPLWQTWLAQGDYEPPPSLRHLLFTALNDDSTWDALEPLQTTLQEMLDASSVAIADTTEPFNAQLLDSTQSPASITRREDKCLEPLVQSSHQEMPEQEFAENNVIPLKDFDQGYDDEPTAALPLQLLNFEAAGVTEIGQQRQHNEDAFGIETQVIQRVNLQGKWSEARGLLILCDGIGGHAAGEVASALAVETLQNTLQGMWQQELPDVEHLQQAIRKANQAIYALNQQNSSSGSARMGTTLVIALIQDTRIAIAHVGDSRIYQISRQHGLEQLTVDHEVGQRDIQLGIDPDIAYGRPDAYQLTQALGPRDNQYIQPDTRYFDVQEDILLLLCSDGLSDHDFIESYWQRLLLPLLNSNQNIEQGLVTLIEKANQHNGHDNITGILLRVTVRASIEKDDGEKTQAQSSSHSSTARRS